MRGSFRRGVIILGDDLKLLKDKADEVVRVVSRVRGAADTKAEQVAGLSYLRIKIRRDAIARYGINASEVLEAIETLGGKEMGQVLEGNRRFALQVRLAERDRDDIDKIKTSRFPLPGSFVPLAQLAHIVVEEGPAQISRENVQRRIAVEANVPVGIWRALLPRPSRLSRKVSNASRILDRWGGAVRNLQPLV